MSQNSTEEQAQEFFFHYKANANGVELIEFMTDGPMVMQSLLLLAEEVNKSFDQKFANTSDFLQELATLARNIEELKNGKGS